MSAKNDVTLDIWGNIIEPWNIDHPYLKSYTNAHEGYCISTALQRQTKKKVLIPVKTLKIETPRIITITILKMHKNLKNAVLQPKIKLE